MAEEIYTEHNHVSLPIFVDITNTDSVQIPDVHSVSIMVPAMRLDLLTNATEGE